MKIHAILISVLLLSLKSGSGQSLLFNQTNKLCGIYAVSNWSAPLFVAFYHIKKSKNGFGLKAGYGKKSERINNIYQSGNIINFGNWWYDQNSTYYYITPIYIPVMVSTNGKLGIFSFGLPIGFSRDEMVGYYQSDPLFGNFSRTFEETHFYAGMEFEFQYWIDIGKKFILSTGINTGIKYYGEAPFQNQLHNANRNISYYPGMTQGVYFNLHMGILISAHKK
ncbi:MAG: hypothetical protein Q8M15_10605 [Bacteroidota bacterium]|nr:hypothetical protein [Bacteroidota bacterium]